MPRRGTFSCEHPIDLCRPVMNAQPDLAPTGGDCYHRKRPPSRREPRATPHISELRRELRRSLQVLRKAPGRQNHDDDEARRAAGWTEGGARLGTRRPSRADEPRRNRAPGRRHSAGPFQPIRSAYLSLTLGSDQEADRVFALLSEGGQIFMPMQETFYASRFAMLRDRFGTSWCSSIPSPRTPKRSGPGLHLPRRSTGGSIRLTDRPTPLPRSLPSSTA